MSERAPRVLLVTEQVDPGGKRSHVDALEAGLRAIGWDARVFDANRLSLAERAFIAGPNHALERVRRASGHRWIAPAMHVVYARRLRALARTFAPDVWHAQEPITYRAVRAAAGTRPVALTIHGPMHREVASGYGVPLEDATIRWLAEMEGRAYREADAVISVDQGHARYAHSFGRTERLWVIENFVDTRVYHPDVAPGSLDAGTEQWIAGRPLVVCPRRLVPKTGVAVAIRAGRALAGRGVNAAILVAGDGPQRAELERLLAEVGAADRVRLMGGIARDAMPGLLRRAAAVLVPSVPSEGIEEATSISVIEAQACGRPVIASNLGGLREIIEHERTGLHFPAGDHDALAAAIERVLGDRVLAERLGRAAWDDVRAHRSHEAGARRYAAIYHELLTASLPAPAVS